MKLSSGCPSRSFSHSLHIRGVNTTCNHAGVGHLFTLLKFDEVCYKWVGFSTCGCDVCICHTCFALVYSLTYFINHLTFLILACPSFLLVFGTCRLLCAIDPVQLVYPSLLPLTVTCCSSLLTPCRDICRLPPKHAYAFDCT